MKKTLALILLCISINAKAQNEIKTVELKRFRVAVQGGFSQMLAKTAASVPAQNRDYVAELKSGYHYGIDASYFISKDWGIGVKFNQFKSSNSGMFLDENQVQYHVEDNITHTFVGPSFATRYMSPSTKHTFIFNIGLGYLGYLNDGKQGVAPLKLTGATFGSALDAGYDYSITKSFAIGAQVSVVGGVLKSYTLSNGVNSAKVDLAENERESLTRLDLSLGARFNF